MASDELKHYGVLGMKWGVRRSKAQLARQTGRNKRDISDEEATEFMRNVQKVSDKNTSSDEVSRMSIILKAQRGEQYTRAVLAEGLAKRSMNSIRAEMRTLKNYKRFMELYGRIVALKKKGESNKGENQNGE